MMAKRSAAELFKHYYTVLVYSLPIKDTEFIDKLLEHDLLSGDQKLTMESFTEHNERSSHFLNNIIKPGLAVGNHKCFFDLLAIMKSSKHDNVKELANEIENNEIESKLVMEVKCKVITMSYCLQYVYI